MRRSLFRRKLLPLSCQCMYKRIYFTVHHVTNNKFQNVDRLKINCSEINYSNRIISWHKYPSDSNNNPTIPCTNFKSYHLRGVSWKYSWLIKRITLVGVIIMISVKHFVKEWRIRLNNISDPFPEFLSIILS